MVKMIAATAAVLSMFAAMTGSVQAIPINSLVYEVKDSNGSVAQVSLSRALGHEQYFAYNTQWGTGLRGMQGAAPNPNYRVVIDAIISDVIYNRPSLVFIEMATVDTQWPEVYTSYAATIDALLGNSNLSGVPIVWLNIPVRNLVPPFTVAGANAINQALRDAEARYPNLWVVPTQQVWDAVYGGGCPRLAQRSSAIDPIAACFIKLGTDPHYNIAGHIAAGLIEDTVIQLRTEGVSRNSQVVVDRIRTFLGTLPVVPGGPGPDRVTGATHTEWIDGPQQ